MLTVKLKISVSPTTEAEIMGFRKGFLILSLYLKNINLIERFFWLVTDVFMKELCVFY